MVSSIPRLFGYATGAVLVLVLILVALAWFSTDHFGAFGGTPDKARLRASPEFRGGRFVNPEPTTMMAASKWPGAIKHWLFGNEMRAPVCPLPVVADAAARLAAKPATELRVTWLGHSTVLVEIDGAAVLTDPMWGERASPSRWAGPKRFHAPPVAIDALPRLDAVVVSHEHYDHLDEGSVRALAARGVPFHVPVGIGAHLAAWGVPAAQIVEHDWWQDATLARRRPSGRDAGAPLQRARHPLAHRRALELVVDCRPTPPRLLQRRHRPHRVAARDRAPRGAVRRRAVRDWPVERGLGRHPPRPRGGAGGARPPWRQGVDADPLVDVRARLPRLVGAGRDAGPAWPRRGACVC